MRKRGVGALFFYLVSGDWNSYRTGKERDDGACTEDDDEANEAINHVPLTRRALFLISCTANEFNNSPEKHNKGSDGDELDNGVQYRSLDLKEKGVEGFHILILAEARALLRGLPWRMSCAIITATTESELTELSDTEVLYC